MKVRHQDSCRIFYGFFRIFMDFFQINCKVMKVLRKDSCRILVFGVMLKKYYSNYHPYNSHHYHHIKTTTLLNCYWEVVNTRKRLEEAMFSNDHYPIELLLENDGCENKWLCFLNIPLKRESLFLHVISPGGGGVEGIEVPTLLPRPQILILALRSRFGEAMFFCGHYTTELLLENYSYENK